MANMRYLMWFDDNPKLSPFVKIDDAIRAYTRRFKVQPNVVLVNESERGLLDSADDRVEYEGVEVRGSGFVRRHNFWVGLDRESPPEVAAATHPPATHEAA